MTNLNNKHNHIFEEEFDFNYDKKGIEKFFEYKNEPEQVYNSINTRQKYIEAITMFGLISTIAYYGSGSNKFSKYIAPVVGFSAAIPYLMKSNNKTEIKNKKELN